MTFFPSKFALAKPTPSALAIILCSFLLLIGCSDGGGDPGPYEVSTQAGAGGDLSPNQRSVESESNARFQVETEPGYRIANVTGCGGTLSGESYATGPITGQCTVRAQFELERYSIGTEVSGGEVTPTSATRTYEETAEFTLTPAEGYQLEGTEATGCGGEREGDRYITGPITDDCDIRISFAPETVSLSGRISPADGAVVDSDINDIFSELIDNSSFDDPQAIPSLGTVQGFVISSETGTGGDPALEHFADRHDQDDYFRTFLQEGQVIRLQISDFQEDDALAVDLDLYLFGPEGELINTSGGVSWEETLVVPETGEYLVNVYAFSGQSKYTLQLLPQGTSTADVRQGTGVNFVPDEMIIKLAPGAQAMGSRNKSAMAGTANLSRLKPGRAGLVKIEREQSKSNRSTRATNQRNQTWEQLRQRNPRAYRKIMTLQDIKTLRRQSDVVYAEPNYIVQALETPNDPLYSDQWHYPIINLPGAWDITTGQEQNQDPVIVAVVDSGVYLDHPDLQNQLIDGYDFISNADSALDGNGIDDDPDDPGDSEAPGESSWHGTHVAGTVAAESNNDNGVAGVSWGARIMPLRALGEGGSGTTYDIAQSVLYASGLENDSGTLPPQRAHIINLSLGGPDPSSFSRDIYQQARNQGVILAAAAGNDGTSLPTYPAAYDSVFSVAATNRNEERADYSNFGNTIDLAAPGGEASGILSTLAEKDSEGTRSSIYAYASGTSMASPHVAGVFALMKAVYPDLDPEMVELLLVNNELTDDLGEPGRDDDFGYGRINALKAVEAASGLAAGDEPPTWPPLVSADPEAVYLSDSAEVSEAEVTLTNEGGGTPAVTGHTTDATWLSIQPQDVDESGLGDYLLTADPTDLNDGLHQTEVIFTLDTGSEVSVQVYLQQGGASAGGELPPIYVLLVDAETDAVIEQTLAQPDGPDAVYLLEDVPPGRYRIEAGSDIDVDEFICQAAEACGGYPALESGDAIQVESQNLTGLDFVARIVSQAGTTKHQAERRRSTTVPPRKAPEKTGGRESETSSPDAIGR